MPSLAIGHISAGPAVSPLPLSRLGRRPGHPPRELPPRGSLTVDDECFWNRCMERRDVDAATKAPEGALTNLIRFFGMCFRPVPGAGLDNESLLTLDRLILLRWI